MATTTTVGQTNQHFVAVCGGSRVVLAQLNDMAIEVNGDIVLDRALTDGSKPWVSACAVAFCSGIRLVVGGELAEAQGAVAIFDCSNGNPLSTHRARAPVLSLSVSGDGKTMAVGRRRPCHRRNLPSQKPRRRPRRTPKCSSSVVKRIYKRRRRRSPSRTRARIS